MKKNYSLTTLLLLFTMTFAHGAEPFKFNNKNLNALMAIICVNTQKPTKDDHVLLHQFSIEKIQTSSKVQDTLYELSGTCNIEYNQQTKEYISFGDEFNMSINIKDAKSSVGKIGIKDIILDFKQSQLKSIIISDPLMVSKKLISLSSSSWAQSDSLINFNPKKKINIKIGRKTAAVEDNRVLKFRFNSHFYNAWSFESFGCTNKKISESQCSQMINSIP